ncbi:MAG: phosphorylcholine transferase LicD [Lachnospiraceae bacterium]
MTKHQEILLEVLTAVDAFCRKQNITYVMLGGTMLGAYRHAGFIPWDDDIDIGMPRGDYERFLKIALKGLEEPYILRHFSLENNVPYAFAHVEHTGTTYIEARRSGTGYRGGVYVEVFPLDAAPKTAWKQKLREIQVKLQKKRLYALIMERGTEGRNPLKRLAIAALRATGQTDSIVRKLDRILQKDAKATKEPSGDYKSQISCYGNLLGHWGRKENIASEVLFPVKEYSFEDKLFFGVQNPDAYLRALYGSDYMSPPPLSEREKGKHEAAYCNLNTPYM